MEGDGVDGVRSCSFSEAGMKSPVTVQDFSGLQDNYSLVISFQTPSVTVIDHDIVLEPGSFKSTQLY